MKKILFAVLLVISSIVLLACGNGSSDKVKETDKLKVVTTNSIIYDITKNIAGDLIQLDSIVPVGKDPHEYEALPEDIKKSTEADLIFFNGLNLETGGSAWFTKLMENAKKVENKDYYAVSKDVKPIYLEGKKYAGKEDPHAWLSLDNGIIFAKNVMDMLSEKDPKNKETYKKNGEAYMAKLDKLNQEQKDKFNDIPKDRKMIVTSEGCFKYFSQAYNIPSAYIWEINTEEEGTPDQITNLVKQIAKTNIKAIFVESSVDDRPMKTIAKETSVPIYSVLFTDSIAEEGKDGDSYYSMMKWNLEKIHEGLSQ